MSTTNNFLAVKKDGVEILKRPLGSPMKIGRQRNADLQLEDPQLSRQHAEIFCEGPHYYLRDLGSRNGTVVGGVKLEPKTKIEIKNGMSAELAGFVVEFTLDENGPPETRVRPDEVVSPKPEWSPPKTSGLLMQELIEERAKIPIWSKGQITLEVADIIEETPDVKTFRLKGKDPVVFSYKPGQFVTILAEIGGKKVQRSYSMSSSPSRPHTVELTVKRVPGGVMSNWLCDAVKLGDPLTVSGPSGKFSCFEFPSERMLFIGAGSGITPLMSMSRWIVDTTAEVDIVMLVSAKTPNDIIFRKELELMSSRHSGFRLYFTMTRNWRGFDSWSGLSGHCDARMLALLAEDLNDRHVFLCGPDPFMECVKEALREAGFPMENLHRESFGGGRVAKDVKPEPRKEVAPPPAKGVIVPRPPAPQPHVVQDATPAAPPQPAVPARTAIEVDFAGKARAVAQGEDTLMELAEQNGIEINYACRNGTCGTCKVLCKSGKVEYKCEESDLALEPAERGQGYVLACVAVPRASCSIVIPE